MLTIQLQFTSMVLLDSKHAVFTALSPHDGHISFHFFGEFKQTAEGPDQQGGCHGKANG
jgi:hypothetical protein